MSSLLEAQLRLIEGRGEAGDAEEATRVASMKLRPLRRQARRPWGVAGGVLALAAAVVAVLWLRPFATDEVILTKGAAKVFVHWESPTVFTAEVIAGEPSVALMGVLDASGTLLSEPGLMHDSLMELLPAERRRFTSGFELDGVDEGETLAVYVCTAAAFAETYPDAHDFVAAAAARGIDPDAGCHEFLHELR